MGSLIILAFAIFFIYANWKVFEKAGQPGWACIIPIYNMYIMLKIANKPGWWLLLMLIPLVNFIVVIIMNVSFAEAFGKGVGFGLGLTFLGFIFVPILAFDESQYQASPAIA